MFKDHIPNFSLIAIMFFELSCSQTDIIPKLCFSDSGRSKTWRFVKISSSNFLTITILSLYEKAKNEKTHSDKLVVEKAIKSLSPWESLDNAAEQCGMMLFKEGY